MEYINIGSGMESELVLKTAEEDARHGDWVCMSLKTGVQCGHLNFSRSGCCHKCGALRSLAPCHTPLLLRDPACSAYGLLQIDEALACRRAGCSKKVIICSACTTGATTLCFFITHSRLSAGA